MTKAKRLDYLIKELIAEVPRYKDIEIPSDSDSKKILLRSLFNVRPAAPISADFLSVQDKYLQEEIQSKGITRLNDLSPVKENLYLWQGDITTLEADAIVNAANSGMLGCFEPCHSCIDNAIHTYAGVQLRLACDELMKKQGRPEETGTAKITKAFNLPSKYILHTVGPIIRGKLTQNDCELLVACYRSCLELAERSGISSIAFCCISTGVFAFPKEKAAEIALKTLEHFIYENNSRIKVILNVWEDADYEIYRRLLS